jgi:hypothetical protein
LQQIKTKKISGPTHPRHHLSREKIQEKKQAAEKKPAGLTARGPWAKAQSTKTKARDARATGQAPSLVQRGRGIKGLVYRVFINQPIGRENARFKSENLTDRSANSTG